MGKIGEYVMSVFAEFIKYTPVTIGVFVLILGGIFFIKGGRLSIRRKSSFRFGIEARTSEPNSEPPPQTKNFDTQRDEEAKSLLHEYFKERMGDITRKLKK